MARMAARMNPPSTAHERARQQRRRRRRVRRARPDRRGRRHRPDLGVQRPVLPLGAGDARRRGGGDAVDRARHLRAQPLLDASGRDRHGVRHAAGAERRSLPPRPRRRGRRRARLGRDRPRRTTAPNRRGGGGDPGAVRRRRARRHRRRGALATGRATTRAGPPHPDLPRRDVAPHAPTRRIAGRRRASPAVPAGVVRRSDGEHRRGRRRGGPRPRRHRRGGVRLGVDRRRPGRRRSTSGRQARVLRPVVPADRARPGGRDGCRSGPAPVARSGRRGARPATGDDVARHQRDRPTRSSSAAAAWSPPGPVTCRSVRRSATIAGWRSVSSPSRSSPPCVSGTMRTCASLPSVEDRAW